MSAPAEARPCRVVLVGMMGSGKTTIGRLVAERTGWRKLDNDQILLELFGLTARQLLEERGEAALRAAEDAALAYGLKQSGPSVIDAAAGTIASDESREALREAVVRRLRGVLTGLADRAPGAHAGAR